MLLSIHSTLVVVLPKPGILVSTPVSMKHFYNKILHNFELILPSAFEVVLFEGLYLSFTLSAQH